MIKLLTCPETIKLAVMYYVRYPLSLRQVEDILYEPDTDICHEIIRYWWNKLGPLLSKEIVTDKLRSYKALSSIISTINDT